jgi:hypothetical protein
MRKVDRSSKPAPISITSASGAGESEMEQARLHFGTVPLPEEEFSFRAYKRRDVKFVLEALFHGKCAYCEGRYDVTGPVDIEHYRPKGQVDGVKPGYWFLASAWSNLLPSCLDCNRRREQRVPTALASLTALLESRRRHPFVRKLMTGKGTSFPVRNARVASEPAADEAEQHLESEGPLLLDPCRDEPVDHLVFHIDHRDPLGIVFAKGVGGSVARLPTASDDPAVVEAAARSANVSERGAVSIQVYGLNRMRLIQERTRYLRRLEFLGWLVVDHSRVIERLADMEVTGRNADLRDEAVGSLKAVRARVMAEMNSMADPEEPFSSMARAWLDSFTSIALR